MYEHNYPFFMAQIVYRDGRITGGPDHGRPEGGRKNGYKQNNRSRSGKIISSSSFPRKTGLRDGIGTGLGRDRNGIRMRIGTGLGWDRDEIERVTAE